MGRQKIEGLDYFSLDVKIFEDKKILVAEEAIDPTGQDWSLRHLFGYSIISLLIYIYRDKGYYTKWDEMTAILFAKKIGTTSTVINNIINELMLVGFFDIELFKKYSIITSHGIQKRWLLVVKKCKRNSEIDPKYDLTGEFSKMEEKCIKREEKCIKREEKRDFFPLNKNDISVFSSVDNAKNEENEEEKCTNEEEKCTNEEEKCTNEEEISEKIPFIIINNTSISNNKSINSSNNKNKKEEKSARKEEKYINREEKSARKEEKYINREEKSARKEEKYINREEKSDFVKNDQYVNYPIDISNCLNVFFDDQRFFRSKEQTSRKVFNPKDQDVEQTNERMRKWAGHFNNMLISQGDLQMQLSGPNGWMAYFRNWLNYIEGRGVVVTQDPPANFQPGQYNNSQKNKNSRNGSNQGLRGAAIIPDGDKDFGKL